MARLGWALLALLALLEGVASAATVHTVRPEVAGRSLETRHSPVLFRRSLSASKRSAASLPNVHR